MCNEITTEALAYAIDQTKSSVQKLDIDSVVTLNLNNNNKQEYQTINKQASNKDSQLNAMAIAPIVNGKPDYNHVGVVYAGTNMPNEAGASGFGSAYGVAVDGKLSDEYKLAEKFLEETQKKVAKHNGKITDVAGFSQSGGYMMKMAAKHGKSMGFRTTSFDDWGKNQFDTLTKKQQEWLKAHPEMLRRYQKILGKKVQVVTISTERFNK